MREGKERHTPDESLDHEAGKEKEVGVLAAVHWGQAGHLVFGLAAFLGLMFTARTAWAALKAVQLHGRGGRHVGTHGGGVCEWLLSN